MVSAHFRPRLRPVETIVVPDRKHGRVLVLRDTQGITDAQAVLPPALTVILARFDGARSCAEIAKDVSSELGAEVSVDIVRDLATQLDEALFLEGATFERALEKVKRDFADAKVRSASHAGGAYPGEPSALASYIDGTCLSVAREAPKHKKIVGLVAPHIDPWRGAECYGHAYGALAEAVPADADTFILVGTSHAPMREPFALCDKGFDTPYGLVPAAHDAIAKLARAARFDAYADLLNHKREHSLEFQAVFLRHVLGDRRFSIVPILAGLGEHQAKRSDPRRDARVAAFLDALKELTLSRPGKVIVVAGADLAHVGPRFGDAEPLDEGERAELARADHASLDRALARDSREFWSHVAADLDTRRVCGLAPIFTLLEALPEETSSALLHYEQNVDPEEGSIVSHAALAFYAR